MFGIYKTIAKHKSLSICFTLVNMFAIVLFALFITNTALSPFTALNIATLVLQCIYEFLIIGSLITFWIVKWNYSESSDA